MEIKSDRVDTIEMSKENARTVLAIQVQKRAQGNRVRVASPLAFARTAF